MVDVPLYRMGHKLILIVFCACFCTSFAQVGDRCKMAGTDRTGTCREITDCPAAEEQAKKGIDQTICGFASDLITAIVCCEGSVEANDNLFNSNFNTNYEEDSPSQNIVGRISQQKCEEYSQPVVSVVQVLPLVSDASPIAFVTPKCDYNSVPLIVGGQPAEAGEFPFMAAIGFNTTDTPWRCGGTLISDRYVITAAHCASTAVGKPVVVRLGKLDLSTEKDGSEYKDYIISRIIVHPGYSAPQKYNDIALLRTREKIKFTNFIRPACLNLNAQIPSDQALATGWGQTHFAGESSDKLMKVTLTLFNNQKCTKAYKRDTTALPRGIDSTMICAGDSKGGKDTCQGDSGGPLVITKKGNMCQFFLIGVTSFGILCGEPGIPAVYTRVSEYVSWIERTIW